LPVKTAKAVLLQLFWFPSSSLGTVKPKLQLRETGSWSFQVYIPKLELGNEYKMSGTKNLCP